MTSTSALGKIIASGMPILIFFALGFEHSVVNMFVVPTGMILGAKVIGGSGIRSPSPLATCWEAGC